MARIPTTIELSEEVFERAAALSNELGKPLADVIEAALVEHVGRQAIAEMRGSGELDGDEPLELVDRELRAIRHARSRAD